MQKKQPPVIVHVDDRAANLYLVKKILTAAGYEVLQAETGIEGLNLVSRAKPDLVILDVHLPDISGFEVCRRLKANPDTSSISVLQISSELTNVDSRVEGLDSGAEAYLTAIRPTEVVATVRALLRAKAAEDMALAKAAEWSTTFDAVNDPILIIDVTGEITQTNASAAKLLGELSDAEVAALKKEFVVTRKALQDSVQPQGVRDIAVQNKVYRMSMDLVPGAEDHDERFVSVLTDVTTLVEAKLAIRRSNEALMLARDAAVTASRAKSAFMSSMSHEFRTPLNAILGYAELMHDLAVDRSDETATKDLSRIIASAQHLLNLISDVLDIAKVEAGRASLELETFPVKPLLQEIVTTLQPLAGNQNNSIDVQIDEGINKIASDPTKLRQILLNLVGNACKFTRNGTITVQVCADDDDKFINFVITDTGIGICEEKLNVIFDAFEQGDAGGKFGGTGLGLAISKRLAELLGGNISAQSQVNIGSTFTLRIPLEQ